MPTVMRMIKQELGLAEKHGGPARGWTRLFMSGGGRRSTEHRLVKPRERLSPPAVLGESSALLLQAEREGGIVEQSAARGGARLPGLLCQRGVLLRLRQPDGDSAPLTEGEGLHRERFQRRDEKRNEKIIRIATLD